MHAYASCYGYVSLWHSTCACMYSTPHVHACMALARIERIGAVEHVAILALGTMKYAEADGGLIG